MMDYLQRVKAFDVEKVEIHTNVDKRKRRIKKDTHEITKTKNYIINSHRSQLKLF